MRPEFAGILTRRRAALRNRSRAPVRAPGIGTAREARGTAGRDRCRPPAGFPAGDPRGPRQRLEGHRRRPRTSQDRRVEITGPTDRKMIINALNSGARVFMADCEDSLTPTWDNVVGGQLNLRDAVTRRIEFAEPGRPRLPAESVGRDADRPAARLAPAREAPAGRRPACAGRVRRLRSLPVPQPRGAQASRQRPVFLSAQDREPPGGATLGRRVPSRGDRRSV